MRNRDLPANGFETKGGNATFAGLTKREAAAIAAMQGMVTHPDQSLAAAAIRAVRAADALFDELEKGDG